MAKPPRPQNIKGRVEREMDMFARECKQALPRMKKLAHQADRMGAPSHFQHELKYLLEVMETFMSLEGLEYDIPVKVGNPYADDPTQEDWIEAIFKQYMPTKKHHKRKYQRKHSGIDGVKSTRKYKLKEPEPEPIQMAEGVVLNLLNTKTTKDNQ